MSSSQSHSNLTCPTCLKVYKHRSSLSRHRSTKHATTKLEVKEISLRHKSHNCTNCNKAYKTKHWLSKHEINCCNKKVVINKEIIKPKINIDLMKMYESLKQELEKLKMEIKSIKETSIRQQPSSPLSLKEQSSCQVDLSEKDLTPYKMYLRTNQKIYITNPPKILIENENELAYKGNTKPRMKRLKLLRTFKKEIKHENCRNALLSDLKNILSKRNKTV